jgi:hypothetical protein
VSTERALTSGSVPEYTSPVLPLTSSSKMNDVSQWHSIRPWRPTLSLVVREITSVSATFILSSPLGADPTTTEQSLASLGISNADENDIEQDVGSAGRSTQIVSDVLSKGLSVKVNGTPWQRVLMKIDDEADEAVIILFGLMPGRQYDVELGIVPNEKILRSQITTGMSTCRLGHDLSKFALTLNRKSSGHIRRRRLSRHLSR